MNEEKYITQLIEKYPALEGCREDIWLAFLAVKEAYELDGKLLVCGNGGSAADAEHVVGELMKEFAIRRPLKESMKAQLNHVDETGILAERLQGALPAIALTGGLALSTAYANDAVPELAFAQQVMGYGRTEDVILGISTSGNSSNVIYSILTAKAKGMKTVGMTGESGGKMKALCDVCICVPETETYCIQELHLPVYHCLCRMLETRFFG